MAVHVIHTGFFKLDGGAMFGVVPRSMWTKLNPPDEHNMCTWAMRCLLVQEGGRNILIDTGIGDKQNAKFRSHFHPHGEESLLGALNDLGIQPEDITDVILTHLHFDHVGGAVKWNDSNQPVPVFPNATYWSNHEHWDWAMEPNPREKASFLKENFVPLLEQGRMKFLEKDDDGEAHLYGIRLRFLYGHTHAMMMPIIREGNRTLVYCADLIPSFHHIGLPYVMAYDIRPLETLKEKKQLLDDAIQFGWELVFEHDPVNACSKVELNDRGRIVGAHPEEKL